MSNTNTSNPRAKRPSKQTTTLLKALLHNPQQWRYAHELSKETGLSHNSVYAILDHLDNNGLLEQQWDKPGTGQPRHQARLTRNGQTYAQQTLEGVHTQGLGRLTLQPI